MQHALTKLVCAAISVASWAAHAGPFSDLYVFGDSLLDSGNAHSVTSGVYPMPPYQSVFTNGEVASQVLADRLGLPLMASELGGNNFATSGATSGTANVAALVYGSAVPPIAQLADYGLQQQVDAFLGRNVPSDSLNSALFLVWAGSNDALLLSTLAFSNPALDLTDPNVAMDVRQQFQLAGFAAAANVEASILDLVGAGAQKVLAGNIPDLTLLPFVQDAQAPFVAEFMDAFSAAFLDPTFFAALTGLQPSAEVILFDAKTLFDAALVGAFGFANTEDACLPTLGPFPVGVPCADPDSYLFWDDIHPTAKAHKLLGDAMFAAVVPEPRSLLLIAVSLGGIAIMRRRRRG